MQFVRKHFFLNHHGSIHIIVFGLEILRLHGCSLKVIRELVMYCCAKWINSLPYLDDLLFLTCGYKAYLTLLRKICSSRALQLIVTRVTALPYINGFICASMFTLPFGFLRTPSQYGKYYTLVRIIYYYLHRVLSSSS